MNRLRTLAAIVVAGLILGSLPVKADPIRPAVPVTRSTNKADLTARTGIFQFASTNGDGTGDTSIDDDCSITPCTFSVKPPAGRIYVLQSVTIFMQVNGTNLNPEDYGTGLALGSGLVARIETDFGTAALLTGPYPVKQNVGWRRFCHETMLDDFGTGGADIIISSRCALDMTGEPLVLTASSTARLEILVADDLSGRDIVTNTFLVTGYSIPER